MAEAKGPDEESTQEYKVKISQREWGDILGVSWESINKEWSGRFPQVSFFLKQSLINGH